MRRLFYGHIAIALYFCIFISDVFSDQILYPRTFNPFHKTHQNELLKAVKLTSKTSVKVLPIEKAYYHDENAERVSLLPYKTSNLLIEEALKDIPNSQVDTRLRFIRENVFDEISNYVAQNPDPNTSILVGQDIFEIWRKDPKFEEFSKKFKIIVGIDPNNIDQVDKLKKDYEKTEQIKFIDIDNDGIRSSKLRKALVQKNYKEFLELLPEKSAKKIAEKKDGLELLRSDFINRVKRRNREYVQHYLLNSFVAAKFPQELILTIKKNPILQDSLVFVDFNNIEQVVRFLKRAYAVQGVSNYALDDRRLYSMADQLMHTDILRRVAPLEWIKELGAKEYEYTYKIPSESLDQKTEKISSVKPPAYLYHWTTDSKMNAMVAENIDHSKVPQRFISSKQHVGHHHSQLRGRSALFAWQHPTTAMEASHAEIYARFEGETPPRLLAMEISPNATAIEIITRDVEASVGSYKNIPGIEKADLILHRAYRDGLERYTEWIVLNPDVVKNFTADVEVLRPLLQTELKKLYDENYKFFPDDLFIKSGPSAEITIGAKKRRAKVLEAVLKEGNIGIPKELQRPMKFSIKSRMIICLENTLDALLNLF